MAKNKRMIEGQLNLFDLFSGEPKGFLECRDCWCMDCKHNAANEALPRDICGTMRACPACDFCVQEGSPEVCIIGSAKEGCGVRAAEEDI